MKSLPNALTQNKRIYLLFVTKETLQCNAHIHFLGGKFPSFFLILQLKIPSKIPISARTDLVLGYIRQKASSRTYPLNLPSTQKPVVSNFSQWLFAELDLFYI